MRVGAPMFVSEAVLDAAGHMPDGGEVIDETVAAFREELAVVQTLDDVDGT